jgi:hypothetical protein
VRRALCLAVVVGCAVSSPVRQARATDAAAPAVSTTEGPGYTAVEPEGLRAFVASRAGQLKACYEKRLRREPSLHGRLSLRFTVLADGALEDVSVTRNELGAAVAQCVTSTVRGWKVPFRPSWPVIVEYPMVFTPGA